MSTLTSVSGFPRIGGDRELKKAIEGYWKGKHGLDQVRATAKELRARHWRLQAEAGIDLIPSNDFSYYDQVLDTAILLNVIPQRYDRLAELLPEPALVKGRVLGGSAYLIDAKAAFEAGVQAIRKKDRFFVDDPGSLNELLKERG